MANSHDPYAVFRSGDYLQVLSANILSSIGRAILSITVGYYLYQRTHDAFALGLVGLVSFVPLLLFLLPAGHLADRWSRKYLVMTATSMNVAVALGLAVLAYERGPLLLVYCCLFASGVADALTRPARQAFLPQIVPEELLANAVTWNSSAWQIASTVGPALGGAVIALAGGEAAPGFLLAAVCGLVSTSLLVTVRPRPLRTTREPVSVRSLLAGVRFVATSPLILATLTLDLFAVLFGGATALLPIFASDILHVGPTGLGWLRSAPGLGALLMGLSLAHRPPLQRAGPALLLAVAGFGVATIIFGLSGSFALSFIMLGVTGALDNISVVVRGTLVQVLTPDAMRGRVSAVNSLFIGSSNELGDFESGLTAWLFGPILSVVGGGIGTLFVVVLVGFGWPEVWKLGPLHQTRPVDNDALVPMLPIAPKTAPTESSAAQLGP